MWNLTSGWVVVLLITALGCREPSLFAQAVEARQRVTSLELQFARAVSASQHAVMADDARVSASVEEAEALRVQVVRDGEELRQLLVHAEFEPETLLLARFQGSFTAYQLLDRNILGLAHEKSNLQAQRAMALTLAEKRALTEACEQALHSLKVALAKRVAPVDR